MEKIRVLVGGLPLLTKMISSLLKAEGGLTVVEVKQYGEFRGAVDAEHPDVIVLCGLDNFEALRLSRELLEWNCKLKILELSADARASFLYELKPQRVPLGGLSEQGVIQAVRRGAARS